MTDPTLDEEAMVIDISEQNEAVRATLVAAGHVPYTEVTEGHRIGETRSGFVVLTSGDGKTLVRMRPGDDWLDKVSVEARGELTGARTAEYVYTVRSLADWSRSLKGLGYTMGQRNSRTLVVIKGTER